MDNRVVVSVGMTDNERYEQLSDNEPDAEFFMNLTLWFASRAFKAVIHDNDADLQGIYAALALNPLQGAFVTGVLLLATGWLREAGHELRALEAVDKVLADTGWIIPDFGDFTFGETGWLPPDGTP